MVTKQGEALKVKGFLEYIEMRERITKTRCRKSEIEGQIEYNPSEGDDENPEN